MQLSVKAEEQRLLHSRGASSEGESGSHQLWNTEDPLTYSLLTPTSDKSAHQRVPGSSLVLQPYSEATLVLPEYQLSRENPVRVESSEMRASLLLCVRACLCFLNTQSKRTRIRIERHPARACRCNHCTSQKAIPSGERPGRAAGSKRICLRVSALP